MQSNRSIIFRYVTYHLPPYCELYHCTTAGSLASFGHIWGEMFFKIQRGHVDITLGHLEQKIYCELYTEERPKWLTYYLLPIV